MRSGVLLCNHSICFLSLLFAMLSLTAGSAVIYVDDDALGQSTGTSWQDAIKYLQDALAVSKPDDEIRIAQGIYYTDLGYNQIPGSIDSRFEVKHNLTLIGGYAGVLGQNPDERDPSVYPTILTGLLSTNSEQDDEKTTIIMFVGEVNKYTNIPFLEADGLVFENSGALPLAICYAGGAIKNCIFRYNKYSISCTQYEYTVPNWPLVFSNCVIHDNYLQTDSTIAHTLQITGYKNAELRNCVLYHNGGGIDVEDVGNLAINGCTIVNNGHPRQGGGLKIDYSKVNIQNSLFWGNTADYGSQIWLYRGGTCAVDFSNIMGGQYGVWTEEGGTLLWNNNINRDPKLVDDFLLSDSSPCINMGNPDYVAGVNETDIEKDSRVVNGRIDIGADELNLTGPVIYVFPQELTLDYAKGQNDPSAASFVIANYGTGSLCYTILCEQEEIKCSPAEGVVDTNEQLVELMFDGSAMKPERYNMEVRVSDPYSVNKEKIIHLTINVTDSRDTLFVPGDYLTIQDAIDASSDNAEIILADGIYTGDGNRDITYRGKPIKIRSQNGPANCIIDVQAGEEYHRGFRFASGETADSVLEGVTIKNGHTWGRYADEAGGAILILNSNPIIRNCVLINNRSDIGGAIATEYADTPIVEDCVINGNTARSGGGIASFYSDSIIRRCRISENTGQMGGGLYLGRGNLNVSNCLISNNFAQDTGSATYEGGGGIYSYFVTANIENCTLAFNNSNGDGTSLFSSASNFTISNSIITNESNWPKPLIYHCETFYKMIISNCLLKYGRSSIYSYTYGSSVILNNCIEGEPLFVNADEGNYHLRPDSKCIDFGKASLIKDTLFLDLDCKARIYGNEVDMGAYEYVPNIKPVANAADITVYAGVDGLADVKLDGTRSYDEDGDSLTYSWYNDNNELIATGAEPNVMFGVGQHVIRLIVNDGIDDSEPSTCTVTVIAPVKTSAKVLPNGVNLKSKRTHVKGRLEFEGTEQPLIDDLTPMLMLIGDRQIEAKSQTLEYSPDDNKWYLWGQFDLSTFKQLQAGECEITIASRFQSGQWVYGTDRIKLLTK